MLDCEEIIEVQLAWELYKKTSELCAFLWEKYQEEFDEYENRIKQMKCDENELPF